MDIKSKINKFSYYFLDENLEIEYENSEWTKDRKKILVKISFFILFSILGFITSYGIHLKNLSSETYPQLNKARYLLDIVSTYNKSNFMFINNFYER